MFLIYLVNSVHNWSFGWMQAVLVLIVCLCLAKLFYWLVAVRYECILENIDFVYQFYFY